MSYITGHKNMINIKKNQIKTSVSKGLTMLEIIISLAIFSCGVVITFGVIGNGLVTLKKGDNASIAMNLAQAQFETYEGNFNKIPFFAAPSSSGTYYYPDSSNPADKTQTGKFINHNADLNQLPPPASDYSGTDNFYTSESYDLNRDNIKNDLIEPLKPLVVKGTTFTPVVEILPWRNGYNINDIKHMIVTVYWKEKNAAGGSGIKHITFEGYLVRTQPDPW